MRTLICGSIAYDKHHGVPGPFSGSHILPEQIHILNVSFLVPELRREFGGCAGKHSLQPEAPGFQPAGHGDGGRRFAAVFRAASSGLASSLISCAQVPGTLTAQAFITTDLDDNQITAFHPGAMNSSHLNNITGGAGARVSPSSRPTDARACCSTRASSPRLGIPFMFRPRSGTCRCFSGEELLAFVEQATYVAVNDYEGRMLEERTGRKLEEMAKELEALVLTRGAEGSIIYTDGQRIEIPCVKAAEVVDPTGLRRRLPRRSSLWCCRGLRLAEDRQTRVVDGLDQDRVARRPESFHEPR